MIQLRDAASGLIRQMEGAPGRHVLGIAGPPGAGKSTAAEAVLGAAASANISAVVVGMDGWHLAHDILVARGQEAIKGAPETFDAHGFVDAVRRIRAQAVEGPSIWLPQFRREIENAIAGAVEMKPTHRLVVVEGNYLLLRGDPWDQLFSCFDSAWMLTPAEEIRQDRLVARHEHHGRNHAEAVDRALGSDERNAERVRAESRTENVLAVDPG